MDRPSRRRPAVPARVILIAATIALSASLIGLAGTQPGIAADASSGPAAAPTASAGGPASPPPNPSTVPASPSPAASATSAASAAPSGSGSGPTPSTTTAPQPSPTASTPPVPFVSSSPLPSGAPTPSASASPSVPAAPAVVPTPPTLSWPPAYPRHCGGWSGPLQRANDLLANRWQIGSHPVVTLPVNRSWTEDPLHDRNWQFMDHSLGILHSMFWSFAATGNVTYRDRASAILQDWIRDNPRWSAPSIWAWNDHSTALRAVVLACASRYLSGSWLRDALVLHGQTLANPDFYVWHGNHALNQSVGLLEVAVVVGRSDWKKLAVDRLGALAAESIDSQGVTNEQSVGYQNYNYSRYRLAEGRLRALGIAVPSSFARVPLMTGFLAYATLPNGEYEMIGDTDRVKAAPHVGTTAEFAATQGASGPRPTETVAVYRAGYLFARTGWGTSRAFADESFLSLRFGRGRYIHGHMDGGAITYYGSGARLLVDPGKYSYNQDAYRTFFVGRTAHNVVTVDGSKWNASAATELRHHSRNASMVNAEVRMQGDWGVTHVRNVTFSRQLGYAIVDDRVSSSYYHTYRQLWHLTEDAKPTVSATSFRSQRTRGNVLVRQLIGGTTSRVVTGRTSPIQGWVAWKHGVRTAAPVVEFIRGGRSVRYLTLIVNSPGTPGASVSNLSLTSTGYSVVVTVGSRSERVVVSGTTASVTPL